MKVKEFLLKTMKNKENWIKLQLELIEKERLAEIKSSTDQIEEVSLKQLEAKGIAIYRLQVTECGTGLFGRSTITLSLRLLQGVRPQLPSHTFSSGDIVGIWGNVGCQKGSGSLASGVISKLTSSEIQVALDEDSSELEDLPDDALLRIHKLANDVTYKRIKRGLDLLGSGKQIHSYHLIEVLFGESEPYDPLPQVPPKLLKDDIFKPFNEHLDESQIDAVKFAINSKDLAVIHGPPGTGKTTTLVEVVLQHIKLGCKILAVAPSNLAVDNLLEKLVESKAKVVRVGHPARATKKAQQRSLDALIQNSDEYELIQDIHKDIKESSQSLSRTKKTGLKFKLREEIKIFRKELKEREMRLSKSILSKCDVVLTTLSSAGNFGPLKLLPEDHFDLTVIDECSQGLECACYSALMKAPKLLIAGDHQQLPPTIMSTEAAEAGLSISLMERVIDMYKDRITRMLKTQYRMNSCIMDWASNALYEGQLKAHESVSAHLLCQLQGVETNEDTENALLLFDTAGCNFEEVSGDDMSKGNEGEATIVAAQVKRLIDSGVKETEVAVISPYNLQVEMIRTLLRDAHPAVEVRSVDGFQGREKEAILISLVRSNKQGEIGFLTEDRRLNVAVTRARRQLTLICDTDTVCRHSFIKELVDYISANGVVRSGHEFESELDFQPSVNTYKVHPLESKKETKRKEEKKDKKEQMRRKEEENEARRIEYEAKISEFVNSDKTLLEFPKNLNSFERFLIHEIATKFELVHSSHGEGKERFIVLKKGDENSSQIAEGESNASSNQEDEGKFNTLSNEFSLQKSEGKSATPSNLLKLVESKSDKCKTSTLEESQEIQDSPLLDKESDSFNHHNSKKKKKQSNVVRSEKIKMVKKDVNAEEKPVQHQNDSKPIIITEASKQILKPKVVTRVCHLCSKEVTNRNFEIHVLGCERLKREKEIKVEIQKRKTEIGGAKKKQPKGKPAVEEDDFKIMENFAKETKSCAFPRCKNPSILLLQFCSCCKNNFCLQHHQAEIHGCGEEARKEARASFLKSARYGASLSGTASSKKLDPIKRVHIQRKLNKKLDSLGDQRKIKKKDEK